MIVNRMTRVIPSLAALTIIAVFAGTSGAQAAPPVKLTLASQFGQEVNVTEAGKGAELEDICTVASKDLCKLGLQSPEPGGFLYPEGVAVAPSGDVYVVDAGNKRIQEFSASGQFLLMFGWDVNKTKVKEGTSTQQEMNVCTETELKAKGECQAGVEGGAPGQFYSPYSIAVDSSGNVYVAEVVGSGQRVQKLTPEGQFVLELGKDVNETKATNLCTREEEVKEHVKCAAPGSYVQEPGSFDFQPEFGNLLAIHEGTLYVGDEGRVQEFNDSTGAPSGEVTLEAGVRVDALAVGETGDVYLAEDVGRSVVREFDTKGNELPPLIVTPGEPDMEEVAIRGLAFAQGHLAVAAHEHSPEGRAAPFGSLYEAGNGVRLTEFKIPTERAVQGIGFNPTSGDLYVAAETSQEILQYVPKPVAALATDPVSCVPGEEQQTDVTFNCTLNGEVDPEGVAQTEALFEWGRGSEAACKLASSTSKQPVATAKKVEEALEGLRPNETYCYQLVAEDENAQSPEPLVTALTSFTTELTAPQIIGAPQAQFVKASSTVMFAELNPENAQTTYFFEYAPSANALARCDSILEPCSAAARTACGGVSRTPLGQSGTYGSIGATSEAVGLRPGTEYSYRLFAENENTAKTKKCTAVSGEGSFTTATVPSPSATTDEPGVAGATSAVIYATVTPDGAPVTYSFELGVYEGAATQYGVVSSGSVEAGSGSVLESLVLTGLQPSTTYAYRIAISSGYVDNGTHTLQGQPRTFPTSGLPAVLQPPLVLTQLPAPPIAFPKAASKPKTKAKTKAKKKSKRGKAKKRKRARV